jgi:hypothetical protein
LTLVVSTEPYAEPVDVAAAKAVLRVDIPDDDAMIGGFVAAARRVAEPYHRLQVVSATYKLYLDAFYTDPISGGYDGLYLTQPTAIGTAPFGTPGYRPLTAMRIPFGPITSVAKIEYIDTDGSLQTLSPSLYQVDLTTATARISPSYGNYWPYTRSILNAVTVTFVAGIATPFTVSTSSSTLTPFGASFANGAVLRLSNSGGQLPSPLATYTDYYVVNASGSTIQLSATLGGSPIAIGTTGTGTQFIGVIPPTIATGICQLAAHYYRNREAVSNVTMLPIPLGIETLLLSERRTEYA